MLIDILPSELPDVPRPAVDTEDGTIDKPTGALFPDDGARVSDVSVAWHGDDGQPVSCAWRFWDAGEHGDPILPRREWDALMDWLASREALVMHNSLYDSIMLDVGTGNGYPGVDLLGLVGWDTMLVAQLLDPGEMVGLGEQSARHLGTDAKKDTLGEIKKWLAGARRRASAARNKLNAQRRAQGLTNLPATAEEERWAPWAYYLAPWELVKPYAASDAELTIRLARQQWCRLKDGEGGRDPWPAVAHDLEIMRCLARMERRGLPYDAARSLEVADKLAARRAELEAKLPSGHPTPTRLKAWFFDQHKVTPLKVSDKTGEPSCDAETIEMMGESGVPGAKELRDYKKVDGAENRWYRAYGEAIGADGRLRPRFRQTSVRSGRLSIERVQLQAVPHNHQLRAFEVLADVPTPRDLIRPEEGWDLWEMDLAQAELRVAAWMANAKTMLEIIEQGRDPHGELAMAAFEEIGRWGKEHPDWFKYRQVGKRGNFSLIFGIGRDRLRRDIRTQTGIELPWEDIDKLRDAFRDMHPEFGRAIRQVSKQVGIRYGKTRVGFVTLVNGRKNAFQPYELDFHDFDGNRLDFPHCHKAFNRQVQGSIGEFAKRWMVDVDHMLMDEIDDPRHGLLLQIHDALVLSVPAGETGEVLAKRAVQIGLDLWDEWFTRPGTNGPHSVPGGIDAGLWNTK